MRSSQDVVTKLKAIEPDLRAKGVAALYIFGSTARGEATPTSDVDVFVDPEPGRGFEFLPYMDAYEIVSETLGTEIDFGTRAGLHPLLKERIEREAVRVF